MHYEKNKLRVLASLSLAATVGLTGVSTATVSANVTQLEADTPLKKENLQKLSVKSVQKLDNGVKLDLGSNEAYIRLFDKDLAKVSVVKKGESEYESRGIEKTRMNGLLLK
ncbi:hypothetical protein [Bacillus coahuilensis]|uniref:hypothetical protein n=1 Tax=Bacillus coahuilensis TaxID=408580 RepID=UPI0001850EF9|nr:hypothetical protein [Bacillus coahuilensis]